MATPKVKAKKKTSPKNQHREEGPSIVTLTLKLEAAVKKDGDEWVAWCIPLDIFTQGNSKQESLASLEEAVQLWFESCIERNVLDESLAESGFRKIAPGEPVPRDGSLVEMKSELKNAGSFSAHNYIEVSIPAYIASQFLPHTCAIR